MKLSQVAQERSSTLLGLKQVRRHLAQAIVAGPHPCLPLRLVTTDYGVHRSVNLDQLYCRISVLQGEGNPLLAKIDLLNVQAQPVDQISICASQPLESSECALQEQIVCAICLTGAHGCHASSLSWDLPLR